MQLEHTKVISVLCVLTFLILVIDVDRVLGLCGSEITKTLDAICHSGGFKGYNTKLKRASDLSELKENGLDAIQSDLQADDDARDRSILHRMFQLSERGDGLLYPRHRRFGIAHECCINSCSYNKLARYCRT